MAEVNKHSEEFTFLSLICGRMFSNFHFKALFDDDVEMMPNIL